MSYVGLITATSPQPTLDGRLACHGFELDNGRGVRFLVSPEALQAYRSDPDEDRCLDVPDEDVLWRSKRDGGRSLWSCAGLPWSIG
jgi:hypothetical protein